MILWICNYFKKKRRAQQIAFDVLGGKPDPRLSEEDERKNIAMLFSNGWSNLGRNK